MTIKEKQAALRLEMAAQNVGAVVLPTGDPHLSEYIPAHWESRRWFSGFTGDAGTLVITENEALLWTDGRFFIQAAQQLDGTGIQLMRMREPGVPTLSEWLGAHCGGMRVALDGRLYSESAAEELETALQKSGASLVSMDLVAPVWKEDRPPLPATEVWLLEERFSGASCAEKLAAVRAELKKVGAQAQFYSRLDAIAWATNLRAADIDYNPFAIAYLLVTDKEARLYLDPARLTKEAADAMRETGVTVLPYAQAAADLQTDFGARRILVSKRDISMAMYRCLAENKNVELVEGPELIAALKAEKNPVECANMRTCHIYDGVAMVRSQMEWERRLAAGETLTEWDICKILEKYRRQQPENCGLSFGTIAAYGPNAAMMHYGPAPDKCANLQRRGLLLIDSGGQYRTGTTDITRTYALGPLTEEEKRCYTWSLQAHIDLASARFPAGTTGWQLDALSRVRVWQHGLDYRCGTGHGVGFMGAVHEGPQGFRDMVPLKPGMSITDEPGLYMEGQFGIRIENTLEVIEDGETEYGKFLTFSPLTLCPIDQTPILPELLTQEERQYLNDYHDRVLKTLSPHLTEPERTWLAHACKPL